MYDGIRDAAAAWREILHVSEWTSLSLGALAGFAALFYFVPLARKVAIGGALLVGVGWFGLVHGDAVGRADLQKQWDDAKAAAEKAQAARDAFVELGLEHKYRPIIADLQKQSDDRKQQVDDYESKILGLLAKSPAGDSCQLGDAALRLRHRR